MSTEVRYTYERAPITVRTPRAREVDFEVDSTGEIMITFETDCNSYEHSVWISAEDWKHVVTHLDGDLIRFEKASTSSEEGRP